MLPSGGGVHYEELKEYLDDVDTDSQVNPTNGVSKGVENGNGVNGVNGVNGLPRDEGVVKGAKGASEEQRNIPEQVGQVVRDLGPAELNAVEPAAVGA